MPSHASADDLAFLDRFQRGRVAPDAFNHRAHVRLAYAAPVRGGGIEAAHVEVRRLLQAFLRAPGVDPGRYHETLMRAWVGAVANLMAQVGATVSFEDSAARASVLLDPAAMGTHYTQERLFSDEARARFVVPDLDPIPGA